MIKDIVDAAMQKAIRTMSEDMDAQLFSQDMKSIFDRMYCHLRGWKLTAAKRMDAMGIPRSRVLEAIKAMEASGNFPDCPDRTLPINAVDDQIGWDGNNYNSYGTIRR